MSTRSILKRNIRRKLDDVWGFSGDVSGVHSASATVIYYKNAANPEMIKPGFVLYNATQDKHYIVTAIDLAAGLVSVQRNIDTQVTGDDLTCYRYWYGAMLDDGIDESLDFVWPKLAFRKVNGSIVLSADVSAYAISAQQVEKVEAAEYDEDGKGRWASVGNWIETTDGYLQVDTTKTLTPGRKLRLTYRGRWAKPANDSLDLSASPSSYPAYLYPIIINYTCAYALELRVNMRSVFSEYTARAEKDTISEDELLKLAGYYRQRAAEMVEQWNNMPVVEVKE